MREHLLVLLIAAVFVYLLTPYARTLALKSGAVAKVRDRDVHTEVTARWGGIAIWLSIMLTILIASQLNLLSKAFQQDEQIKGICIAATVICLLGVLDDKWGITNSDANQANHATRQPNAKAEDHPDPTPRKYSG